MDAGRTGRLVGRIVLVQEHERRGSGHGRQERRAGSDSDPDGAAREPHPRLPALALGHPAVQPQDRGPERGAQPIGPRRSRVDLRRHDEKSSALGFLSESGEQTLLPVAAGQQKRALAPARRPLGRRRHGFRRAPRGRREEGRHGGPPARQALAGDPARELQLRPGEDRARFGHAGERLEPFFVSITRGHH